MGWSEYTFSYSEIFCWETLDLVIRVDVTQHRPSAQTHLQTVNPPPMAEAHLNGQKLLRTCQKNLAVPSLSDWASMGHLDPWLPHIYTVCTKMHISTGFNVAGWLVYVSSDSDGMQVLWNLWIYKDNFHRHDKGSSKSDTVVTLGGHPLMANTVQTTEGLTTLWKYVRQMSSALWLSQFL